MTIMGTAPAARIEYGIELPDGRVDEEARFGDLSEARGAVRDDLGERLVARAVSDCTRVG